MRRRTKHHDPFDIKGYVDYFIPTTPGVRSITNNGAGIVRDLAMNALEPFRIKNQFRKQHIGDLSCVVDWNCQYN
jgi:hypothetical protein